MLAVMLGWCSYHLQYTLSTISAWFPVYVNVMIHRYNSIPAPNSQWLKATIAYVPIN